MADRRLAIPHGISNPIYKGYVNKQGGNHKNWKTRYAVLYPHLLVYYEHSAKYEFDVQRGSLENRKNHVILQGAQVVQCRSSLVKLQFAFTIIVTATDNKRTTYIIANSSYSERDLWMAKVNDAINGGAQPQETSSVKANPKLKLLTKQSTLKLLDSQTADSVRNAMVDRDSESDIDDTDSENESESGKRRSAKSQATTVQKSYSTHVPDLTPVIQETEVSASGANKPRPMLSKESASMMPMINTDSVIREEGISMDDNLIKDAKHTVSRSIRGIRGDVSDNISNTGHDSEEIIITWCCPASNPTVMLGKEGFLYKQGGKHKTWKHRYMIAVPGRLAYYKAKPHSLGDKAMGIVKLKNITCCAKPGLPKFPNLFEITSNSQWNKRSTYVFSASSSDERAEWIEALEILGGNYKAHIEELTERQQSLGAAIGSERRAISFSDAVTQSIDEDDYLPKGTPVVTPEGEGGKLGEESVCKNEKITSIEPPTAKTKRYVEEGYDLDISYITSNILVMSFPYSKEELANFQTKGRNDIEIVESFLNNKYKNSYRVYNLCKEKSYPETSFNGNIVTLPFEDHCPPPLKMFHTFIKDMQDWLSESNNVAVIHCNSGKGRSGCMVASYLIYAKGMFYNEAIDLFNTKRINFGRGLSVPSHLRYIKYVDRINLNPNERSFDKEEERTIQSIQIMVPTEAGIDWKPFVTIVSVETNQELFNSVNNGETAKNVKSKLITIRKINLTIKSDFQINIWDFDDVLQANLSLDAYLFLHTSFVTEQTMLFKKADLDKLYKLKVQGFSLSIKFAPFPN